LGSYFCSIEEERNLPFTGDKVPSRALASQTHAAYWHDGQISGLNPPVSPDKRGVAHVTNARWDAVDVDAPLTNGA
jgi:hypothetical protein